MRHSWRSFLLGSYNDIDTHGRYMLPTLTADLSYYSSVFSKPAGRTPTRPDTKYSLLNSTRTAAQEKVRNEKLDAVKEHTNFKPPQILKCHQNKFTKSGYSGRCVKTRNKFAILFLLFSFYFPRFFTFLSFPYFFI